MEYSRYLKEISVVDALRCDFESRFLTRWIYEWNLLYNRDIKIGSEFQIYDLNFREDGYLIFEYSHINEIIRHQNNKHLLFLYGLLVVNFELNFFFIDVEFVDLLDEVEWTRLN